MLFKTHCKTTLNQKIKWITIWRTNREKDKVEDRDIWIYSEQEFQHSMITSCLDQSHKFKISYFKDNLLFHQDSTDRDKITKKHKTTTLTFSVTTQFKICLFWTKLQNKEIIMRICIQKRAWLIIYKIIKDKLIKI